MIKPEEIGYEKFCGPNHHSYKTKPLAKCAFKDQ
jgi:hypothetical protein